MNIFSEQKALELATTSSFQKGTEYFEEGLVEKLWHWKPNVLSSLKEGITSAHEAQIALHIFSKSDRTNDLSLHESGLYVFLHYIQENFLTFERICLNHLKKNPVLAIDLFEYYKKIERRI